MEPIRIHCNSCKCRTWHQVEARHSQTREDDLFGIDQLIDGEILRCMGCDQLSFRLIKHPFDFEEDGQLEEELYPERGNKKRARRHFFKLPKEVNSLYNETLVAHDRELKLLSTVGLRALIEAIVANKIPESEYGNNLESKIGSLSTRFPANVIDVLHEFRVMGNKAIHAQVAPEKLDVHRALYVVEGIMEYFYGIEDHAESFRRFKKSDEQP